MSTLSTRQQFQEAQKATDRALRTMFEQMSTELAGILAQAADANGVIPPAKADEVRAKARKAVAAYFVQERAITGQQRADELERLHGLIDMAQKEMKKATERQKIQLRGRVTLLSRRIAALEHGRAFVSYDDKGNGVTPYAKILQGGANQAIRAVIEKHTKIVKERLAYADHTK